MKKTILAAALLASTAFATPASALIVNVGDVGLSGTTVIQGIVDPGPVVVPGLTGTLFLKYDGAVTNLNGTQTWTFDYTVDNTSSGAVTQSRISSFGFGTTPNIAVTPTSTGLFDLGIAPTNGFPNVGGAMSIIEMCFSAGNGSCSGGGGVDINDPAASGTFSLTFGSALSSISLDAALFRFQEIASPGFADSGVGINTNVCPDCTPVQVPGPIVGAGIPGLLTACFGMFGLNRWRRRRNGQVTA